MKKTLLTVVLSAIASMSFANFYVQGDVGYSQIKEDGESSKQFAPRLSLGVEEGDYRFAIDYQHVNGKEETETVIVNGIKHTASAKTKLQSVGVSAFYDFKNDTDFTPYVGVRLAHNKLKFTGEIDGEKESASKSKVGYGVVAGVDYNITSNLSVGVNVEYNYLGKFEDMKIKQFGVNTGIRYKF